MVDFAGWSMPVKYSDQSLEKSHLHTRRHCSIFDVSHMMQSKVFGKDKERFMEGLVVSDIKGVKENCGTLTVFTNDQGGILDDLIVNKTQDGYLYIVSNAGCRENDLKLLQGHLADCKAQGMDVGLEIMTNPLIAVQGPATAKVLSTGVEADLSQLYFMQTIETTLFGVPGCRITRCGYTGEDGVEISIPEGKEGLILEALMTSNEVKLAGLGARDSLRLEAGLCLYGNDIDVTTTPIEAGLGWLIGKRRKECRDFPGAERILQQIKDKPTRKRFGLLSAGAPPRAGSKIFTSCGLTEIGHVTSGCPSPSLKTNSHSLKFNIAMGYIQTSMFKVNMPIKVEVRKKMYDAHITKMPFIPANYYLPPK